MTMFPDTTRPNSVCYAGTAKFLPPILANPHICAVIVPPSIAELVPINKGLMISDRPVASYYQIHNRIAKSFPGLVPNGHIAASAHIASSAIVGERVHIGEGVTIDEQAVVYNDTVIGDNSYIGPGAILGTRGMQNIRINGQNFSVDFLGGVSVGENCEVLARAIIQKPYHAFFTEVRANVKISIKVSIGHGSYVGENTMIAGNCTVAGNVTIGKDVWIGPDSVFRDGISVGDHAKVMLGSTVAQSVQAGQTVSGLFAMDHAKSIRHHSKLKRS